MTISDSYPQFLLSFIYIIPIYIYLYIYIFKLCTITWKKRTPLWIVNLIWLIRKNIHSALRRVNIWWGPVHTTIESLHCWILWSIDVSLVWTKSNIIRYDHQGVNYFNLPFSSFLFALPKHIFQSLSLYFSFLQFFFFFCHHFKLIL